MADRDPTGMERVGVLRSEPMLTPAITPMEEGKNTPISVKRWDQNSDDDVGLLG